MTIARALPQRFARRVSADPSPLRLTARQVPILLLAAWGALLLNVLTPAGASAILPIPYAALQVTAQGSLVVAILLALLLNPRMVVRPNLFLLLLSLMAVEALMVSIHGEFPIGSTYRAVRLVGVVACLWLLTPWWGRFDLALFRVHRIVLAAVLGTVVLGAALAPGAAFSVDGRLAGVIWPVPPPQVAHYAAVFLGTTVILWMCRVITGRHALTGVVITVAVLVGTHTRTAVLGLIIGLVLASASLFLGHARVRRTSISTLLTAVVGATLFASQITNWAARGQSAEDASQLTGRTHVWSAATSTTRPIVNEIFGNGLSNKSFDGLAIDGNWVASYLDLGWFGVVVQATFLLLLIIMAVTHVRGPRRALAIFLITYSIVASITEVALCDATPYLLDLVVAASLLVPGPRPGDG